MKNRLTTALSLLAIVLGISLPVMAQNNSGALNLTTSPLPISLKAKPGETVSTDLRIKNSGNNTETLKVGLMKFSAGGDDGKPKLMDREPSDDYFDWVHFSETTFVAVPNVWNTIKMTINIPKTAGLGYYYAVTFGRTGQKNSTDNTAVQGATATLVLLDVESPNAQRQVELEDFSADKRTYEFLPVNFTIKVKNTGNIHLIPTGTVYITQGNKNVATLQVNESAGNILPSSSRVFNEKWTDGFPVYQEKQDNGVTVYKNGKPQHQLNWEFNQIKKLRFGRYKAHLTLVYDNGQRDVPLEAEVSFWVIPWRLLAVFIGIPLIVAGLIVYLIVSRRKYKKRTVYRHGN